LAEFRLVGPVDLPAHLEHDLHAHLQLHGPVPRAEIARHFVWADVFLLPSVCEGSATVVYEALAAGLPVVTTPNAGSVVRDGIDGFVCPCGDAESICEKIEVLGRDRNLVATMAREARLRSLDYDVASYGRRLLAAVATLDQKVPGGPFA
jgi:glycosyltransferase involved in cell wall biosynthesis